MLSPHPTEPDPRWAPRTWFARGMPSGAAPANGPERAPPAVISRTARFRVWVALCLCTTGMMGCRTTPPWPVLDLSQPGWVVRMGQAVWRPSLDAPELAGELMVARHRDGSSFFQFTKTPLPIIAGQVTPQGWQVQFFAENKTVTRLGPPPTQLTWLYLPVFLSGESVAPDAPFQFRRNNGGDWTLLNLETQEQISGYLDP